MSVAARSIDFLVVGGGVIGISIARETRRRNPGARVCVLEKEAGCGQHASGRNSGVVHAGFYYSADSLKARFTRDGNQSLVAYAEARGLPINRCGKLVVARNATELAALDELFRRGERNGVPLELISADDARRIEPRALTHEKALFSPSTASIDPARLMHALCEDARREGVELHTGVTFQRRDARGVLTSAGRYAPGYLINSAGLHADRVARSFGFSEHHRVVPFRGLYLLSDEPAGSFRTNIYPVPDLRNPFLGVHFTLQTDGRVKIGPTAIPALWREQYAGLANFRIAELAEIVPRVGALLTTPRYRSLAWSEAAKVSRRRLVHLASHLATGINPAAFRRWGRVGIRAQLLDLRSRSLEMDFLVEGDDRSMHVLNAVSPGWTCAFPFARYVVDRVEAEG